MLVILAAVLAMLALVALVWAVVPQAAPAPSVTAAPSAEPVPIALVIGDSQAHGGQGVTTATAWVAQGLLRAGYDPEVQGHGGTGYLKGRPRNGDGERLSYLQSLQHDAYSLPPAQNVGLVVVQGGGNDASYPDRGIEAAASDVVRILKSKYPHARFAIVGPLNQGGDPGSRRVEVTEVLAGVADGQDAAFIDATDWVADNDLAEHLHKDGLHLNQDGHDRLAAVFTTALDDAGLAAPRWTTWPRVETRPT
ncbi:GDSL family lipase [Arthrobacter crystallopoietes BAB-32]|uniref:GDSL family lipase n=1 Tax=Arthrobacter crystallopoietes BAB-32 TaxID=1246476 RepID=N1UV87_9MICC|nr:GDSL family lipase [Arthrobacter crystallopoietes BAB-32]